MSTEGSDGIILDLPVPPSVNVTRRVSWPGHRKLEAWRSQADRFFMAMPRERRRAAKPINGQFSLTIILSNNTKADCDNLIKACGDFLVSRGLVQDDSPKFLRRITVEYGDAPEGVRLILRPWGATDSGPR